MLPSNALPHEHAMQLLAYVQQHAPPSQFVGAVLRNDLASAFLHGTHDDIAAVPAILAWLYARAPIKCFGSTGAVAAWVANYDARSC